MSDAPVAEPDRIEGAPHPRDTVRLIGQGPAEAAFLAAHAAGRLHHAWLLCGPRGVGKATLAWRIARFLLAEPPGPGLFGGAPESLDIAQDDPVARRIHAGSEPRLFVLRRAWDDERKRLKTVITVDEVRRLRGFLQMSAADGGRRAVIVDAADEMNVAAANALLKMLEEPPEAVTFLIVAHQPSRLLPTIRSRCRPLRLAPLSPADLAEALSAAGIDGSGPALSALAGGSVGEAIRLAALGGAEAYGAITALFAGLPRLDRMAALALADSAAQRGADGRLDLLMTLLDLFLARLARAGALGQVPEPEAAPGEAALMTRLAPDAAAGQAWAALQQSLGARARHGRAVNLDPAALILDMILKIDETGRAVLAAEAPRA